MTQSQRRYDLDWLRVIAFAVLILYHCGMFFVGWDWHVQSRLAGENGGAVLEPIMWLCNPWRLPLLFLISGVAVRFALDKTTDHQRFAAARARRLFIPLIVGMLILVPPQSWLQLLDSGETTKSYLGFYPDYLAGRFSIITPTWNHLWYLAYVGLYSLAIIPFAGRLRQVSSRMGPVGLLCLVFGWHGLVRLTLDPHFPTTHALIGDWANHAHSLGWFVTGFAVAKSDRAWRFIARRWTLFAGAGVALAVYLSAVWSHWDVASDIPSLRLTAQAGRVAFTGCVILGALGAAQRWLNRPSAVLTWLGGSVFAWYIFHQTVTVVAGVSLTRLGLSLPVEIILLILVTIIGTGALTELARRSGPLRIAFGFAPRMSAKPLKRSLA